MPRAGARERWTAAESQRVGRSARAMDAVLGLLTVFFVTAFAMSDAQSKPRGASAAPAISSKQMYLDQIVAAGAPGAIARIRRGSDVWRGVAGFADKARTIPTDTGMIWRIASVTKMVSAHIALALEREGVLRLSDRLGQFNAYLPQRYRVLRLGALMDQSSRVPEYLDYDVFGTTARTMLKSIGTNDLPERALNLALARAWFIDEMAEHQYANTNYVLLQHAMEQASGASFGDLMAFHVINPLELTKTGLVGEDGELPALPQLRAYIRDDNGNAVFAAKDRLLDVTRHHFMTGADGGMYSNADELAKVMDFIWSANTRRGSPLGAMTRRLKTDHDGMYRYGYGVMAMRLACGRTVYGHEGLDLGSVTYAFADRENRRQLIVVANLSTDENLPLESALQRMRDAVFCSR
jgi:D-alanyl-D-alanine carboxypeptidase